MINEANMVLSASIDLVERITRIVGNENVLTDPKDLVTYSMNYGTFEPQRVPDCVVKVKNITEITEILKIANEKRVPVIPSSSRIHFHGATIPAYGGILLDMSEMNRIIRIDIKNRKAIIEPGVTWEQLQSTLFKHELMAFNPLLPPANKSALTSILEREPPLIPKFEYADPIMSMLMVLPTGDILPVGAASALGAVNSDGNPAPDVDLCHPYGPGINWYRLVQGAQGTLGIVTWMNIKIGFLPTLQEIYLIPFETLHPSIDYLYKVLRRMIGHECFVVNKFVMANVLAREFPKDFNELINILPPFVLVLVLAGGRRYPQEKIDYEREYLNRIGSELTTNIIDKLPNRFAKIFEDYLRKPWPKDLPYWKIRYKGNFQDIQLVITMDRVPLLIDAIYRLAAKRYYPKEEIGIYLQPIEYGRVCYLCITLFYNPNDPVDIKRTFELYKETLKCLLDLGAFFSTPYGYAAKLVYERTAELTSVLRRVKKLLDPNNIMNPDKLCF